MQGYLTREVYSVRMKLVKTTSGIMHMHDIYCGGDTATVHRYVWSRQQNSGMVILLDFECWHQPTVFIDRQCLVLSILLSDVYVKQGRELGQAWPLPGVVRA